MLQFLIPVMKNITIGIIPIIMIMVLVTKEYHKGVSRRILRAAILGMLGALAVVILEWSTGIIDREIYEGLVLAAGIAGEILLLIIIWRDYKKGHPKILGNIQGGLISIIVATISLYRAPEIYLSFSRLFIPSSAFTTTPNYLSTEFMLKFAGFFLGVGFAILIGLAAFRTAFVMSKRILLVITTVGFIVVIVQQWVGVTQILLGRGIIPMTEWLFEIMVPLINYNDWFIYVLLMIVASFSVIIFLHRKQSIDEEDLNPAECRKIRANLRKQLRWSTITSVSISIMFILSTVGSIYASEEVVLSEAVPVVIENSMINIPLESIEDDELYRYGYTASDGTKMRFIVVKKGDTSYGVALDACDICGPSGYYQRKDLIICKLCDVVMNKATIGFKGGCNPVPFEYQVKDEKIVIKTDSLEKEKERFQ